jgi:glycosyltransferase involved in cell wall biosynthesis
VKLAFVTPWYGPDAPGGSEALARSTAEQLCRRGIPVEVLTTCARDIYSDWGINHYRSGVDHANGVTIRRFPVRPGRDRQAFDAVNLRLMAGASVSHEDEKVFMREMIGSPALLDYINAHRQEYVFLFIAYMFGTTYWGAQVCPERSWLVPCLHDESYAHMAIYREMFAGVRGLLFLSQPEMALAQRLYPIAGKPALLVGAGVDTDYPGDAAVFRSRRQIAEPFILYAGRRDVAKNVPLLVDYFRRYRQNRGTDLALVLTGGGSWPIELTPADGVYDLGRIDRRELFDAYAAALVLCQPSVFESFSYVLMEAWVAGTPGLVYEPCAVTTDFVRRANGGLYFSDYEEFEACVSLLLRRPDLRAQMGAQGRDYVSQHFAWDRIAERYAQLLQFEYA